MTPPAFDKSLRTVAVGGRAVRLSKAEMAIFSALVARHPSPVAFNYIPAPRRHVFIHRLREKLHKIGCGVSFNESGYTLDEAK